MRSPGSTSAPASRNERARTTTRDRARFALTMRVAVVTFCSFLASGVSRRGRVEVWSAGKRSLNEELHFRLRHEVRQALGTRVHVLGEQNGPWPARRLLSGCRNTGVPSPYSFSERSGRQRRPVIVAHIGRAVFYRNACTISWLPSRSSTENYRSTASCGTAFRGCLPFSPAKSVRPEVGLCVATARVEALMNTSTCWPTKAGKSFGRNA